MSDGTPRAAVLGSPIAHSLSPLLHRAAYAATGLDWDYTAIECDETALPDVLERVRSGPGWRGLSLTMPLKLAAVPLVDDVDGNVDLVGALNTIVVSAGDDAVTRLTGHNTDIGGVTAAMLETGAGDVESALVLGAGGTARACVVALANSGVRAVIVAARDVSRTAELVQIGELLGIEVAGVPWASLRAELAVTDLVVATTPAGATDSLADPAVWRDGVPLIDVLYDPWPTKLAAYAAATGSRVVGGIAVLAYQAGEQFTLMTGVGAPMAAMRAAGENALAGRRPNAT